MAHFICTSHSFEGIFATFSNEVGWHSKSVQEFMRGFTEGSESDRRVRLVAAHVQTNSHGLIDHNPQRLDEKIALAERVLRCYLQPSGKYDVQRGGASSPWSGI